MRFQTLLSGLCDLSRNWMYTVLLNARVADARQLFDDTWCVANALLVSTFYKGLCSSAMKNRYLAHAQHHPPFHDSALPKRKLDKSCTVKSPSQYAMDAIISKGKSSNKPLVVAGCVPQGSRDLKELEGISIVGVQQIDRVVEIVEETLKGHEVRLLTRKKLPALDLPKVWIPTYFIIPMDPNYHVYFLFSKLTWFCKLFWGFIILL